MIVHLGVDQGLVAPLFLVGWLGGLGLLEGKSGGECWKRVKRDWGIAVRWTWLFFPGFQLWSFMCLPVEGRVLALSLVDVGFNCMMSLLAHGEKGGGGGVRVE